MRRVRAGQGRSTPTPADAGGDRFARVVAAALVGATAGLAAHAAWPPAYRATVSLGPEANATIPTEAAALALDTLDPDLGGTARSTALESLKRRTRVVRNVAGTAALTVAGDDAERVAAEAGALAAALDVHDSAGDPTGSRAAALARDSEAADLDSARQQAEDRLAAWRAEHASDLARDPKALEAAVSEERATIADAEATVARLATRLDRLDAAMRNAPNDSAVANDSDLRALAPLLDARRAATAEVAKLQPTLGDRHPDLVDARAKAAEAERRLAEAAARIRAGIRNEADAATTSVQRLKARLDGEIADVDRAKAAQEGLAARIAELEASRQAVAAFASRAPARAEAPLDETASIAPVAHVEEIGPPLSRLGASALGALLLSAATSAWLSAAKLLRKPRLRG